MQLYLDGFQNNFFTFFYVKEKNSHKVNNKFILPTHNYLKNKNLSKITLAQKQATENVFRKKEFLLEALKLKIEMKKLWENYFVFLF